MAKSWIESDVYTEWLANIENNENYWKGKQHDQPKADKQRPLIDNVIFESLETYLPQVALAIQTRWLLSRKEKQTRKLSFRARTSKRTW